MYRVLYSSFFYLAFPLILLRLWRRSRVTPDYGRRWQERLGRYDSQGDHSRSEASVEERGKRPFRIWIHAVSVGESVAALPLIDALAEEWKEAEFVVTNTTPTGADMTTKLLGNRVRQVMSPYDTGRIVNRFLDHFQPDLLIIMETELWPNMLHYSSKRGCKILLANARLSKKSARGYSRFPGLVRQMFAAIDAIAVQSAAEERRFIGLGYRQSAIHVAGSLKFIESTVASTSQNSESSNSPTFASLAAATRLVLIAASTREGEEEKVLAAFRSLVNEYSSCLLVLVPRHPERFAQVEKLIEAAEFKLQKRSDNSSVNPDVEVLLGDSMGEMDAYYRLADIAFVGGSLVDTGCQNVIEPASLGLPVLTGPSQYNFQDICDQLSEAGALVTSADEDQLGRELISLAGDLSRRQRMGSAGRSVVAANQQGLHRHLAVIFKLFP